LPTARDYEQCRRIAHRWDELDGPPLGIQERRDAFWLRCERCTMVRAFVVSQTTGTVVWSRYWAPAGYYWQDRTQPAPTRQDFRLDWLREIRAKRR